MAATFTATPRIQPYAALSPAKLREEYKDKEILITGGGYGIGAAITRAFAEAHVAAITIAGRTESKLKEAVDELTKAYTATRFSYRVLDITSEASVTALFDSLVHSPDVLVNNAGYMSNPANFVTADLKDWWRAFEVNVLGTAFVTQAYLRHRATRYEQTGPHPTEPEAGVVITLNTFAVFTDRAPGLSSYAASKAAMLRALEMITFDVSPKVARFVSVNPGAVKTDMYYRSGLDGSADIPNTEPQLAGEFIAWSASKEADFLNGRLAWSLWDVEQLVAKKGEILEKDLLISALRYA